MGGISLARPSARHQKTGLANGKSPACSSCASPESVGRVLTCERSSDGDRPRPVRPPVEDARRALAEPFHHRARQHDPQCCPADTPGGIRRFRLGAAVDGRLVSARLRGSAARVRDARRPFRTQARTAGGRVDLRARQPRRPRRRLGRRGDRRAGGDGRRRCSDHAGHPVDHRQRLHGRGARQGDRDLGRVGGGGDRARAARRRVAARMVRVVVRVPGERPVCRRRAAARHSPGAREP